MQNSKSIGVAKMVIFKCFKYLRHRVHTVIHRLLLIKIKRATMCMNQRPIKRRDMHVGGSDNELHDTRIQYKNLNMHNHSLSFKSIQPQEISIEWIRGPYKSRD